MNDQVSAPGSLAGVLVPLPVPRYAIVVHDGPDAAWRVRRFQLTEGLSRTYELHLELYTEQLDTNPDGLLGASLTLDVERDEVLRCVHGVVDRVDYVGLSRDRLVVRAHVVPALRLLDLGRDSRIFQGKTVPEILEEVLSPALGEYTREADIKGMLKGTYDPRDYCVQYRESVFAFASRLMEEAGIAYAFEHDTHGQYEKLVLYDANTAYPELEVPADEIRIIPDRATEHDVESIAWFDWCLQQHADKVISRAHNWKDPEAYPTAEAATEGGQRPVREVYEHDDRRHVVDDLDDDGFRGTTEQREPMALRRLEELAAPGRRGHGQSIVTGLRPGLTFVLAEHNRPDLEQARFLVTEVISGGDCPEEDLEAGRDLAPQYGNTFECMPVEVPFRPAETTPKPRMHGPQTAVVTGPAGSEIHVDRYGRIKAKFHWDRKGPDDDASSCWIRVAQMWAHGGWGTWFVPRVGMEVVIDFLEGNPDRPLCIGCVYHGGHDTPYPLPDEKTKSTIKSSSSPGGEGFNELRFDDAKDHEEIYIHGQKDLRIEILHDVDTRIDHNETRHVGGDRQITVVGNQIVEVKGQPPEADSGKAGSFRGSCTSVSGDYKVAATSTAFISAPTSITLSCPGSSIVLEPGKITISAGGGASIVLDANALMKSAGGSHILLDGNAFVRGNGGGSVLFDANANMTSSAGSQVLLDGNAAISGSGGGNALFDANAKVVGGTATVASSGGGNVFLTADAALSGATTTCAGAGGSVKLDGGGAAMSGAKVDIGGGVVNIG